MARSPAVPGCVPLRFSADWISGTWLNACGVLPTWRPVAGVVLLAQQPDVVAQRSSRSNSSSASSYSPIRCSALTSQKLQARNAPSPPVSPSTTVGAQPRPTGRASPAGAVPQHQPVADQLALDGPHRRDHPRVVGGQEADLGDQQHRGVQLSAAVVLGERAAPGVVALARTPRRGSGPGSRASGSLGPGRPSSVGGPPGRTRPRPSPWSARSAAAGPRTSQIPSSGSSQCFPGTAAAGASGAQVCRSKLQPAWPPSAIASITSPYTSSWRWLTAALPIRTGAECS